MHTIFFREAVKHIIFVLPNTATQIIGYADIERTIFFACHDIDVEGFH